MSKELKKLVGQDVKHVTVNEKLYKITPLNLMKVETATEALDELLPELGKTSWLSLIGKHGNKVVKFISAASEIDEDILKKCPLPELLEVCDGVMEVNVDFFLSLREKIAKWTELFHGQKSSNSSLRKVTNTKT